MNLEERPYPFVLASKEDAERILKAMLEILKKYGVVSLSDLYNLAGLIDDYYDTRVGWTKLEGSHIIKTEDGYILLFPILEAI